MNISGWLRDAAIVHSGSKLLGMLDDAKIARHYRDISRHPSLQTYGKRIGSPFAAFTRALFQGTPLAVASIPASAVVGIIAATYYYPEVAGKQYQSVMTGQPTASDPNLLFGGKQGLSYFKFN